MVGDLKATGTSGFPCASSEIEGGAGTGGMSGSGSAGSNGRCQNGAANALGPEHVWWLVSPNTKQVLAAYIDPRYGNLVELPLPKCIEIWGYNPRTDFSSSSSGTSSSSASTSASTSCVSPNRACCPSSSSLSSSSLSRGGSRAGEAAGCLEKDGKKEDRNTASSSSSSSVGGFDDHRESGGVSSSTADSNGRTMTSGSHAAAAAYGTGGVEVQVDGMGVAIPWVPPKFVQWLAQRRKVRREICNMRRVGSHRNVVKLLSVLELLQDSKSTLFLILELVAGGELLDHIRPMAESTGSRSGGGRAGASALRAEGSVQRYFGQLLSGLSHCHRQGVCHRYGVFYFIMYIFFIYE